MNMRSITALGRGCLAVGAMLAATALSAPVHAAGNCNPNQYKANPNNQITYQEYDALNNYAPVLITLGVSKAPSDGVVFTWAQIPGQGPTVQLNTSNPAAPTFLAPAVTSTGATLKFRLTATCPDGDQATDDTGTITISNVNRPPMAIASATPVIALEGETITLRSTAPGGTPASNDPDGDTLVYQWTRTTGPAVTLIGANTATASFTAPVTGGDYTLQFQLLVRDRPTGGLTNTASVVVNVTRNLPPLAALQCPESVNEGDPVLLDGRGSNDPNGQSLTYAWSQLQGTPSIAVGGETGNTVAFNAPVLTTGQDGFVEFELKVTDTRGLWDLATCMLEIRDVTRPVISVPTLSPFEATSPAGSLVTYGVSAVDNVDGDLSSLVVCVPPSGSIFGLGAKPVDCEVADSIGNTGNASFSVTVRDTTPPVIDPHNDVAFEATGPGGAVIDYESPGTYDVVDTDLVATCTPLSGSNFALGSHTVTCDATDYEGNQAVPTTFVATVHDTTAPTIGAHSDVIAEATGSGGAMVIYTSPATHDMVDGDGIATCAPASGSTFALGTTLVICSAADAAGNAAVDSHFNVIVADTTPPTIDPRDDIADVEATGPDGAVVIYNSPATHDAVDGNGEATCAPASGSVFALGTTQVTCSASDNAGNAAVDTHFNVTVVDSTPPTIDVHDNVGPIEATSAAGAQVFYTSPATHDAVSGDGTATCTPTSGSIFALGDTTVTCAASDAAGNAAAPTQFVVTVRDSTPPTIDPHADILGVEATGPDGAGVSYTSPATHDLVDGDGTATCTPASGSTFALGSSLVTCSASDAAGNAAQDTQFQVTVIDSTAPLVTPPANVTTEATGPLTAVAHGTATATDAVGVVSLTNNAPATFPLGTTTITWTATDAAGNSASATSTVTVVDTTAPAVSVPATIISEAISAAGAPVSFSASAVDLVYGNVPVACVPASGSTFALGTTTVTCSATDGSGNTGQASFSVTVRDTTAPEISYLGEVNAIAGSNSSAVVNYNQPTAWDLVDGAVPVNCTPASGSTFPVGSNTVTCTAKDSRGNTISGTFKVNVSYAWNGFFKPVDMWPVLNSSKAGSAIPLKFNLGGYQGMSIMAAGYPKSAPMSCGGAAEDPLLETVTAGQSSLQYDASANQYIYVWKSEKSWAGTCRQIQVKLIDGTTHTANFSFK